MPSLEEQLRQFAEKTKLRAETVTRKAVLDMAASMVARSPVDTGRFRGAWVYGAGVQPTDVPNEPDPSGAASTGRMAAGMESWAAGQTIWIVNNLPYAYRLEHGWSKQAPSGMVSVTVTDFQGFLNNALKGAK